LSDGDVKRFLGSGQLGHAVVQEYLKYLSSGYGWNRIKNLVSFFESEFRRNTDLWGIVGWILLSCQRYKDVISWMSDWKSRPNVSPWALYNLTVALRQIGRWQEALAVGKRVLSETADHTVHEHRVWTALESVLQGDASAFETLLPLIDPQELGGYDLFAYYLLSALQSLQGQRGYLKAVGRAAHEKLKQAAASLPAYRRHRQLELLYRRVVIAISKQLAHFPMSLWWRVKLHYIGVR
jgi:hypothetical protein